MAGPEIIFQPEGLRVGVKVKKTIMELGKEVGADIRSPCGDRGICGKCTVVVRQGGQNLEPPTAAETRFLAEEDISKGFRLACCATTAQVDSIVVEVPLESKTGQQRLLVGGVQPAIELKPAVRKVTLNLPRATLQDVRPDTLRLMDALREMRQIEDCSFDYQVLHCLPEALRSKAWTVTATLWRDREVIMVEPGEGDPTLYGFAIDIGTTKLAGHLIDLRDGRRVATSSMVNPQIPYGEEVIARTSFVMKDAKNLETLHQLIIDGINELVEKACAEAKITADKILDMVLVGNPTMTHILLNITPKYVALAPYVNVLGPPVDLKARELKIRINQGAYVHVLPSLVGFIGADALADILATEIYKSPDLCMTIDIGTNTEIALGNKDILLACSCPSGPAWEGMQIKHGMRATTGAIERVWIDPETLEPEWRAIDRARPRGICGSGMADVVSEMMKAKIIGPSGKMNAKLETSRIRVKEKVPEYVLAWKDETASKNEDVVITQIDINQIQFAKAAIYTGCQILMNRAKVKATDISTIYLGGAFGNFMDPESARTIGLLPDVPLSRIRFAGNTAGTGARMSLLSTEIRQLAVEIAKRVKFIQLAENPEFQDEFANAVFLPNTELERFPTVRKMLGW